MKTSILPILLALLNVATPNHGKKRKNKIIKDQLWRRHINKNRYILKKSDPYDNQEHINVTKVYDVVSKYHRHHPAITYKQKSNDLIVPEKDMSKNNSGFQIGVRRSECIPPSYCHPYAHEVFQPGEEKTYDDPLPFLNRYDNGPFHQYENDGQSLNGGEVHGSAIVTHQMEYQSSPNQVFINGEEKTQPGAINGGFLQPSPVTLTMPDIHIHKKPVHVVKQQFRTSYLSKDERKKKDNPCMNGGLHFHLGSTEQCICQQGFMGKRCQEKNHCYPNPCGHESHCEIIKDDPNYRCICRRGYFGETCQSSDPCYPNPCKNMGVCSHDDQNATCVCHSRYRGPRCELMSNCQPNPCANGGVCAELLGDGKFVCQCDPKWKGTTCDKQSYCHTNPCSNGGTCHEAEDHFECECNSGYRGSTCTERICAPNPCSNGGTCVEDGDNFRCVCHPWNTGDLCDVNRPCLVKPCLHDGTCIDAYSGYHWSFGNMQYYCLCKQPYKGMNCETHPCKNCHKDAHCDVDHCVCDDGFEGNGEICEKTRDPCHPNPCFNEGICIPDAQSCVAQVACGFKCECNPPFRPPLCKEKNPCVPNPCINGQCGFQQGSGEDFKCSCEEGYKGKLCNSRDGCIPNPCQHGGKCASANGTVTCSCPGHYKLPYCKDCDCPVPRVYGEPSMFCNAAGDCVCPDGYEVSLPNGICKKTGPVGPGNQAHCIKFKPCLNGATCTDLPNSTPKFRCDCQPKFYGKLCQYASACNPNPCKNGGTCSEALGKFEGCKCTSPFTPPYCTKSTIPTTVSPTGGVVPPGPNGNGICTPNPCKNKGICLANRGSYDCLCSLQFTGPHCEVDRCANCHPRASCVAGSCQCNKGYIGNGQNCEKEDCDAVCVEWSTCIDGNCVCDPGYSMVHQKCTPTDSPQ